MRRSASGSLQQLDERRGDVHVGRAEQLQRAAQHVEVVVLVAQRAAATQHVAMACATAVDRGARTRQLSSRSAGSNRGSRRSAARPRAAASRRRSGCAGRPARARASSRAVTSSIVAITPTMRSPSRSGPSVTRCCMCVEVRRRRRRRARHQVVMERRREDLHLAGRQRPARSARAGRARARSGTTSASGRPRARRRECRCALPASRPRCGRRASASTVRMPIAGSMPVGPRRRRRSVGFFARSSTTAVSASA